MERAKCVPLAGVNVFKNVYGIIRTIYTGLGHEDCGVFPTLLSCRPEKSTIPPSLTIASLPWRQSHRVHAFLAFHVVDFMWHHEPSSICENNLHELSDGSPAGPITEAVPTQDSYLTLRPVRVTNGGSKQKT